MLIFNLLITLVLYLAMPKQLYFAIGFAGVIITLIGDFSSKEFMAPMKAICKSKLDYVMSIFLTTVFRFFIMCAWPGALITLFFKAFPAKVSE